jgi:small G protein signaling modulator 3
VDGLDVLFRIALAILKNNEQELLACKSIPAVYVALESLPTRMWPADKLLSVRTMQIYCDAQPHRRSSQLEAELRPSVTHAELVKKRYMHVSALSELVA